VPTLHCGKRWGVEVDLKHRAVNPPKHPMPPLVIAAVGLCTLNSFDP
jgi:hypothetical protein